MFGLTLQQMLTMFILIAMGYLLRKTNILPKGSDTTLARLETYLFTPALTLSSQLNHCNLKTFSENAPMIIYGAVLVLAAIGLAYPISKLFIRKADTDALAYQRNIYKYAAVACYSDSQVTVRVGVFLRFNKLLGVVYADLSVKSAAVEVTAKESREYLKPLVAFKVFSLEVNVK